MADRFWKSMPAALKKPTLDELYRRLRDLDYTQIDERMAVMLNDILQLEEQGECRESATEAVLMVGYTTEGISNQEPTRWLSWNVDGGVRGFDLARNPGLSNNTEYGAGEFPLPTRPSARSTGQSSSKVPSMMRAQQTTKAYPDLGVLKKEIEKTQRERNKANLDRDQAKLDREKAQLVRDQAVNERDQTLRLLEMLRAEHQQELRVRENAANCEQLKSEMERIEQRQRELDAQKGARQKERVVTSSRPESRMEVDEAPRARGRFNLDREAREHMSEGLEVWIPNEATSSLRSLETQPIRPLMDVVLPGYTPTSTSSGSQVSGSSLRLKELNEKLRQKSRESSARAELLLTWREQPVRSDMISSYKKNTEKRYHRHNRLDWNAEQKARRDCFHDAAWVEYLAPPRVPECAVHLIIGDSLLRVLTRIQSHWQTGVLSFAGAATPQILATLEMLGMTKVYTVTSDPLERSKTRNTSRPWWVALETLKEMEDCLKKLDSGVARKRRNWATQQKAEVNKIELANQLKRSWQNLLKDHFEEAMRTPSSAPPLMANPFVRTAGQLMFTWSLVGIELETLSSYDRLKLGSKKLEVYQALMQHVARDNSGLSLARRKDATCFLRWVMSMMSDSTILACYQRASGSRTVEKRVSTIILNVYQSTGIEKEDGSRLSLENHRKLDEVRRFYNKKFEEEHDVHRNLASPEQYSRLSEKGEYQYVSGVMGIAYNPFLDSETGGAHRSHEVAELLKFWTEKIVEIDAVEKERPSLGLILEKTAEVVSIPRSNKRVEVNMGDGNGLLITNLGVVWKLLRPSWCPHPHASLIEETTERMSLAPTEDEDLAKLSVVHKLILPQMKESGEKTNNLESATKMEPGSCLDSTCGSGEHTCDGRPCVRILSFQKEDLVTWFEDITEREKSEIQIVAECYARTTVNIATALGFFSRMCSLQSLERLESEHHLVTALSVESWPGVLQVTQKHIRSWKVGLEAEMGFPMSEAYGLSLNAKSLIGSMMANLCGSHYPLHMAMVEASSQRILVDKAFSVPKCVRLARVSHKLLRKIRGTVPKELRDDLSEIWGEELLKLESENTSDHERQNEIGKPVGGAPNMGENDTMHEKKMELEPLLEASGERNLRSIEITHGECPCHCLAQTVWYPNHKNLCLVWDMEEIRSIGLPDHRQKVTLLVVSTMLALRWIEENITKYREAKTPTAESIYAIDYSRRLELFETSCKVFAIPMEVRHVWSRLRYFPWFRATLTSWLYMTTKDHMRKHQKEYRQFQAEIGPEAFKRPLLTHRNAITTGWKRVGKMSRDNTKARESILEADLAKSVSLSLHNSFCLNRESRVKALPNQAKRLQEQREWMQSYEQLKAWEEIVISSEDEEELLKQFAVSSTSGYGTSKAKSAK